jgi:hypothetical protein
MKACLRNGWGRSHKEASLYGLTSFKQYIPVFPDRMDFSKNSIGNYAGIIGKNGQLADVFGLLYIGVKLFG